MNESAIGSTFEISLRILLMLDCLSPMHLDEQQIEMIDFIAVYAADFGLLDENLHGYSNYRYSEFPARKQNFIEYLIAHTHERQVIIVEQTKRMPFIPDESDENNVHVIRFSRNKDEGRFF